MSALSNAERAILRRAIAAHPAWPEYRRTHGCDTSMLSASRAVDVAAHLGIDLNETLNRQLGNNDMNMKPVAPAGMFDRKPAAAAPAAAAPAGLDAAALAASITATITAAMASAMPAAPSVDVAALADRVTYLEALTATPALLVVDPAGNALGAELPPSRHPMLETLVRSVGTFDAAGHRLNVWISGPTGSGKTYAAKQTAAALGLDYGFHGAMTMQHELLGFVDAGGRYQSTQFVERFRTGGLCLLDELDSWGSDATLALNSALANGQISLPSGEIVNRHGAFACIGAGNTFGLGSTAEFCGRNKLDQAFLSRFPVKLAWGYDEKLERDICGNADWARQVQRARKAAAKAGLKVLIDPRVSMAGAALISAGFSFEQAAEMTYLAGLPAAQVSMLAGA